MFAPNLIFSLSIRRVPSGGRSRHSMSECVKSFEVTPPSPSEDTNNFDWAYGGGNLRQYGGTTENACAVGQARRNDAHVHQRASDKTRQVRNIDIVTNSFVGQCF